MICALCPTYGRPPALLANVLALYLAQEGCDSRFLMYDDLGNMTPRNEKRWGIISTVSRAPSLPAKYDRMCGFARIIWPGIKYWAVMEDDDVFLPWYLSSHYKTLEAGALWSHPTNVWSLYTGSVQMEPAAGRFHGAMAISDDLLIRLGGWTGVMPPGGDLRADFDQRLIGACARAGAPGRPDADLPPAFVFRWGSSGCNHAQGLMRGPEDLSWYGRVQPQYVAPIPNLQPVFDAETAVLLSRQPSEYWTAAHGSYLAEGTK